MAVFMDARNGSSCVASSEVGPSHSDCESWRSPVRQRVEERDHVAGDRTFDSASFGVAGADQPCAGLVQFMSVRSEPLDLGGELGGQLGIAERHGGLVCKVSETGPRPVPGDDVPLRRLGRRPRPVRRAGRRHRQRRERSAADPRDRASSARSPSTSEPRTGCRRRTTTRTPRRSSRRSPRSPTRSSLRAQRDLQHDRSQPHVRRHRSAGALRVVRSAQHRPGRGRRGASAAHPGRALRIEAAAGVEPLLPNVQPAPRRAGHR